MAISKADSVENEEIAAYSLCINIHWCFIIFLSSVDCAMKEMTSLVWSLELCFPYHVAYMPTDHLQKMTKLSGPEKHFVYRRQYWKICYNSN